MRVENFIKCHLHRFCARPFNLFYILGLAGIHIIKEEVRRKQKSCSSTATQ